MSGIDALAATVRAGLLADEEVIRRNQDGHGLEDGIWPDLMTYDTDDRTAAIDYIERFEPKRTLADVESKRALLELMLAEPHHRWPGLSACAVVTITGDCNCGRDVRVAAYLRVLAEPYQETT